jgi:hypothetical protein
MSSRREVNVNVRLSDAERIKAERLRDHLGKQAIASY